ncbi:DUF309 domain-containing protein [Streptomyces sp. NPDC059491]|uniref:DUF309 domain-containing protein n=1 Tax=Streptomyces sp. NPDC059491 TaxID=3346850 RepID=UPI0036A0D7EF
MNRTPGDRTDDRRSDAGRDDLGEDRRDDRRDGPRSPDARPSSTGVDHDRRRDRDAAGRARSARPRDGLGRPLPYGTEGVPRQPEGVVRAPSETLREAQRLLDAGMPFHAHEVFEDAWKSGPEDERDLWQGLAQLAVGLTHAARGNTAGGARLLRRGAARLADATPRAGAYGIDADGLVAWARELAARMTTGPREKGRSSDGDPVAGDPTDQVDPVVEAPRLRRNTV